MGNLFPIHVPYAEKNENIFSVFSCTLKTQFNYQMGTKMENAEKLLSDVSEKLKIFETSQKESGELFNIFSITKIERREVDTHSAMIAELLNPQGRHGQHDKFLIEFLKIVMPVECQFTETKKAKISKEKSFDNNRIDILIELDDHVFVIENKIDADDLNQQLKRYKDILDSCFKQKSGHLLYLTIDGSEAEEYSHCGVPYRCVSYENHILNWLDSCIETLKTPPKVEYALRQYQDLIKKITGQSMTHNLKNELVELLLKDNNFESAQKIASAISLAKGRILFDFFETLGTEITKFQNVSIAEKNSFPDFEYDEEKCRKWFFKGKEKTHYVGIFFDIGIPDILFRIEAASQMLHYGIVSVKKDENEKTIHSGLENMKLEIPHLKKREWGVKWFSKIYRDVSNNVEPIRGENVQNFINEMKNEIAVLRKAAGIKADE